MSDTRSFTRWEREAAHGYEAIRCEMARFEATRILAETERGCDPYPSALGYRALTEALAAFVEGGI